VYAPDVKRTCGESGMMKRLVSVVLVVPMLALGAMLCAEPAYATGQECKTEGFDSFQWSQCTTVNGSGLKVNYVTVEAVDNNSSDPGSFLFPNASDCTLYPGFVIDLTAGGSEGFKTLNGISCQSWDADGGSWVFQENKNMPAGEYCGTLDFPVYGQVTGDSDDCVGVHS